VSGHIDPAPSGEAAVRTRSLRKAVAIRLVFLLVALVTLYILWPSLITVFRSWPDLLTLNPLWYPVMLALEAASFVCIWGLQRLSLATDRWFAIATAQLAGNAVSKVVPGGAASGGAAQFKMLTDVGIPATRVGAGLAVASLISTGGLFALPILSVPAALLGRPTPSTLAAAAWLGAGLFVIGFAAGWLLFTRERALRAAGRAVQAVRNKLLRSRPPLTDLPGRLVMERTAIAATLEDGWWKALLFSLGNWIFDYLALLAALAAVGTTPRPTLVLLAYTASMVLAMIPITPGGLGFVEAGLTGLLVVAGVSGPQAALAVLAYRLVSYWLPLPIGGVGAYLHRRRYHDRLLNEAT
jgi:uncharacterized protein (TIRG00374 family)